MKKEHPQIGTLKQQLHENKITRREFLRYSTLLGLSATAAYTFADKFVGKAHAQETAAVLPKGGNLRFSMRVHEVKNPHAFSWSEPSNIARQVCEYLSITGHDNVTRPYLLESWEASDDLKTWDLKLRKDVKWHNGRDFVADDVVWNIQHVLDPNSGSSIVGLMKGYMLNEDAEGKVSLWDANAIEKIDDHTVRLNLKAPQLAVPEHLFHYPFLILDPEEKGEFDVGSNGTGAFELIDHQVGIKSVLKARTDYWGEGPYLDTLTFIDLGDDPSAPLSALASQQIDTMFKADINQLEAFQSLPNVSILQAETAQTGVARVHVDKEPFTDPRVRKAMRLAIDTKKVLELAHRGVGSPGEHHHVSPVHPDYFELPFMARDVEAAKKLLAEAGYPDGIDTEIAAKKEPAWELDAVQAMVEQWKDANIRVKINVVPSAQFWDIWTTVPFGFTEWTHRPLGFMVLALAYRSGVPWNESHYSNPEFDELLAKAEATVDLEARKQLLGQLEEIMQQDGPIIQPLWRSVFTAASSKVKGFAMHPTSYVFGNTIAIES